MGDESLLFCLCNFQTQLVVENNAFVLSPGLGRSTLTSLYYERGQNPRSGLQIRRLNSTDHCLETERMLVVLILSNRPYARVSEWTNGLGGVAPPIRLCVENLC